jgi:hypothetical protein
MNWIISDIHGCIHTLEALLSKIKVADESPKLVFVGDYLDRGLFSKEVLSLLVQLSQEGAVCLRGNHDDVVDWLLNDHSMADLGEYTYGRPTFDSVTNWWTRNGLIETFKSYGVVPYPESAGPYGGQCWGGVIMRFREAVPEDHKAFLKNLPLFWESETHFACHAYFPPDRKLSRSVVAFPKAEDIHNTLWKRFTRTQDRQVKPVECCWEKIGVFGHTPVNWYEAVAPIRMDKIRLIDCWVAGGNYLCAYCCETDDHILQSTDDRDYKPLTTQESMVQCTQ